ncbi:Cis-golgi GTPase-activating protein [Komagataella phaffii]|uniref:Cis-golgi GTPase-activating protein (GAP) n=2 Tax=Komagataella phaffii TaxID=460519 RepID=C4QVK9_KOMPG|nr:Cis-golgi GTPase-activating protein (GAP) [Komagataella phaffii GS115]AOA61731.1 GQ67_02478T0 [Komagataella phaffii]AOA66007.1 GQ68_02769T0 [Komagataella phaffii GS115]CAY67282.1 Cis-golgi GTPase-activating protein (GAP) [Komagataella phaffii GS115]
MGRRKGYQKITEMSQVDHKSNKGGLMQANGSGSLPFFFKSLTNGSSNSVDRPSIDSRRSSHRWDSETSSPKPMKFQDDDEDWDDDILSDLTIKGEKFPPFRGDDDTTKYLNSIVNQPDSISVKEPTVELQKSPLNKSIRKNFKSLIKDPLSLLSDLDLAEEKKIYGVKFEKFYSILQDEQTNEEQELNKLQNLSWNGIPKRLRMIIWQMLLRYMPINNSRRVAQLERKRQEYQQSLSEMFKDSKKDNNVWHQISIDIPRTNAHVKFFSNTKIQDSMSRILYIWAIRHPASGYVQGINDLVTPFFHVFFENYMENDFNVQEDDIEELSQSTGFEDILKAVEADTFWCLTKLLDTIQDNYIHEQPGIHRQISNLVKISEKVDNALTEHLEEHGLQFIQFAFRWMNCLLMREFRLELVIRMWDTYLSEFPQGFKDFHVFVCCAFLMKFSEELKEMEFQDLIMFLQDNSKTSHWNDKDIELLLSEAFIWQSLYKNQLTYT